MCLPIVNEMVFELKKKDDLPYEFSLYDEAIYNMIILRTENILRCFACILIFELL